MAAGLLCLATRGSAAQEESEGQVDRPSSAPPPRVYSTATVVERALSQATSTVYIVDRSTLEPLGLQSAAEAIDLVPGVHLLSNGSSGGVTSAQIRGGDPNMSLVLVDGVPWNDPTDTEGGAVALNTLPADSIERIEIVAGAQSAHFGSTGLAGVIHVITRRPVAGAAGRGSAGLELGAADRVGLQGGWSRSGRHLDHSVAAYAEREAGRIGDDDLQHLDLRSTLALATAGPTSIRVSLGAAGWDAEDYSDASGGPVYGSGELRRTEAEVASAGVQFDLGARGAWRRFVDLTLLRRDMTRDTPPIGLFVPGVLEHSVFSRAQVGFSASRQLSEAVRLNGGVELSYERADVDSLVSLPPVAGGPLAGDYEIDRSVGGPYAELLWQGRRTLLELGARVDRSDSGSLQLSPRLGFARQLSPSLRIRGSAGRAFKLPSFFALASPRALGGNPELMPEVAVGADLGIEKTWPKSGSQLGVSLFRNLFRDLVDFDFDRFVHVNRGEVEARGVELAGSWQAGARFTLRGAVTHLEAEERSQAAPLLHRPELRSRLTAHWIPYPGSSLHVGLRQVGSNYDRQLTAPGRDRVDEAIVAEIGGAWDLGSGMRLSLRVDNVGDERYETLIGFPGPTRQVRVRLSYRSVPRAARPASPEGG